MNYSQPFPGQNEQMFKDKFGKWPRLMRAVVLISLLPPVIVYFLVNQQVTSPVAMHDVLLSIAVLNVTLFVWGLLLKIRARKYWYRNYHIGKTMLLSVAPIIACGYILITDAPSSRNQVANQPQSIPVRISIDQS